MIQSSGVRATVEASTKASGLASASASGSAFASRVTSSATGTSRRRDADASVRASMAEMGSMLVALGLATGAAETRSSKVIKMVTNMVMVEDKVGVFISTGAEV